MEAGATLFPPLCLTKIINLSWLLLGLQVDWILLNTLHTGQPQVELADKIYFSSLSTAMINEAEIVMVTNLQGPNS